MRRSVAPRVFAQIFQNRYAPHSGISPIYFDRQSNFAPQCESSNKKSARSPV
ncbi:hypothetical protein BURPS1106B_A2709 [Burkholderia pseudomallei 1106b]|uniref:Uncharacterized protein n=1 Tax=Burkholderia pseudomallei (strain 1106a) TaxID=357348 RepID=A3NZG0_BURP0|nr:hypothetical protein BURPS1106A_3493 [Burkholderia pseudomallei 1106a]AFR17387.1 hypothetical protein BPC006_I3542 [Burkholderia pseudomallei BPC006]EES25413.1 hypothetical protein BURPS1106B_A2709 [Burkholderia pseudomallei 1106b]